MQYLVTGATGFVGSHVVRQLVADGHQVRAIVRHPEKAQSLAAQGVELYRGDVTDKASMRTPMMGVDGVFHIAGWYKIGTKNQRDGELINVQGTANVLELMQELNVPKGVYTSTLGVNSDTHGRMVDETYQYNGPFLSAYEASKWSAHYEIAEPMIKQGLPLVIVQPGLIYGPGDTSLVRETFIQYLKRKLPMLPKETTYSWAHVEDIASAHILAMTRGRAGESYIISGPTLGLIEAMQLAEKITGIPAPRIRLSPAMMRASAGLVGVLEHVIRVPETYSSEYLKMAAGTSYIGDNSKAQRELGYQPRSLEEGLRETLLHEMKLLGLT